MVLPQHHQVSGSSLVFRSVKHIHKSQALKLEGTEEPLSRQLTCALTSLPQESQAGQESCGDR